MLDTAHCIWVPLLVAAVAFLARFGIGTFVHECGHSWAIKHFARKVELFGRPPKIRIYLGANAHVTSDFFDFLGENPDGYQREIRHIARAGVWSSSVVLSLLTALSLGVTLWRWYLVNTGMRCLLFGICLGLFLSIFLCVVPYLMGSSQKLGSDGSVISQPDRFLVLHPDQFRNLTPYQKDVPPPSKK